MSMRKIFCAVMSLLMCVLLLSGCAKQDDVSDIQFGTEITEKDVSTNRPAEVTTADEKEQVSQPASEQEPEQEPESKPESQPEEEPEIKSGLEVDMSDAEILAIVTGEWEDHATTVFNIEKYFETDDGPYYVTRVTNEFAADGRVYRNTYGYKRQDSEKRVVQVEHMDYMSTFDVADKKLVVTAYYENGEKGGEFEYAVVIHDENNITLTPLNVGRKLDTEYTRVQAD